MDSQIPRQQDLDSNEVMEGEEGQGKTSMFKKMKAKARKIKDTLKMKTGRDQNDQSPDEDEEDDEEAVEDSEVHDAVPMHESPEVMNTVTGQKPADKLENPTPAEDRYDSKYTDPQTRPFLQWPEDENTGEHGIDTGMRPTGGMKAAGGGDVPENRGDSFSFAGNFGTPPGSESAANFVHREGGYMGQPKITTETPISMEEDPHAPKDQPEPEVSNYQSKVADPTGAGGEEAGVSSILQSFNKMNVYDEPKSKPISEGAPETFTGSHVDFSPEPINLPPSTLNTDDPKSVFKSSSFDANETGDNTPLDSVTKLSSSPSSYTDKISYATSAISDKAIAAKNMVASKLGYGVSTENPTVLVPETNQGSEEIGKLGTPTSPGYGSAITGKAIAAKDVVVSKLGYGVGTKDPTAASPETYQGGEEIGKPATGYGQKIVAAVYEKASNVGSSVVSKVRGTGSTEQERGGVEGQDQGGVRVKEYLAEKLRPSEEDKALSEVISDALHNRKGEVERVGGEEGQNENKPVVGIVIESEEVRERLGSDRDSNREMTETEAQAAATGKGYVESLKGTVASWFSRGGDQKQTSDEASSPGGAVPGEKRFSDSIGEEAVGHVQNGVEERRLQESGN